MLSVEQWVTLFVVAVASSCHRAPSASHSAGSPPRGHGSADAGFAAPSGASPSGWRLESSHGVQIAVPENWAVNDYGCNMTAKPTVVRGVGAQAACLTEEAPTKELAFIGSDESPETRQTSDLARRAVSLGGVDAERAEGKTPDGRHIGSIRIGARGVLVLVKARDRDTLSRILDSAKIVDVDHNGCPDRRPGRARPAATHPRAAAAMAPGDTKSISICYYGESGSALQSSARLIGEQAAKLAEELNRMPAGLNPDADPKTCLHPPAPPPLDAVLFVEDAAGKSAIYVRFAGCVARGLDNGARRAQVRAALVRAFMLPLHTGYGHNGDL